MTILHHIPPDHGVSLLYICKAADLFPIECRDALRQLEEAGQVQSYTDGRVMLYRRIDNHGFANLGEYAKAVMAADTPGADVDARLQIAAPPRPTVQAILTAVAANTGVAADDFTLTIHRRKRPSYVRARAIAAYELRQQLQMSYPEIARVLGFRSHVSVMHAVKTIYARTQHAH